ncbi:MAG: hypothetical protein GY936_14345 [Ignavibacteriae bacterium]|nr:hypothetical protein [Ignavibacteriota bacterium]
MNYEVKEYNLTYDQVNVNLQNVISEMGYPNGIAPPEIIEIVEKQYKKSKEYVDLRCGFVRVDHGHISVEGNLVHLENVTFRTEKIVSVPLTQMKEAMLFVVTIGHEFDEWSRSTFNSGDPLAGFIIDLLGSELAESTADWIENKIVSIVRIENKKCSNRYSPGYCGWDVSEQHKLFSFFPEDFCGISLTKTALMKPHKSVSGIIGIGEDIIRREYPCDVCNISHCYKNRK